MWQLYAIIAIALVSALALPAASAEVYREYTGLNSYVEVGPDYTNTVNYDTMVGVWKSSPPRILDYVDPQGRLHYANYKLYQDPYMIKLETENAGSLIFSKVTCTYDLYENGIIYPGEEPVIPGISWSVKGKMASNTNWSTLNTINNAVCSVDVETTESTVKITGTKSVSGMGKFQIELYHESGKHIKETMRGYNDNPAWTNHHIGFSEKFVVPQIIKFGSQEYNLINYNGTTLGRTWIENNNAKLIKLSEKINYDFGIGFDNLERVRIGWNGTHATLTLDYLFVDNIVPYQTWFEVDPTFSTTATNTYGIRANPPPATTACPTTAASTIAGETQLYIEPSGSVANYCQLVVPRFDVSSMPSAVTITNSSWIHTMGTVGNARNCDVNQMTHDPTTANPTTLWNDALNTANGTTFVDNSAWCTTTGAKNIDLGTSADSYFQSEINSGVNVISFAYVYDDMVRNAVYHEANSAPAAGHVLVLTYVLSPPNRPSDLACDPQGRNAACTWTASSPLSGFTANNVTGYIFGKSINNSTFTNKTTTGNITAATFSSYLRPGLLYYMNITAKNINGNSTTSDFTSFTADTYPDAPTIILAPINSTAVNATRTAGASNGGDTILWFALRCEDNASGGWQTITANSSLPSNNKRTVNGLWSSGQVIKCQWADGNRVGFSAWSANGTYPPRPDAITDLAVVAAFQTTAQISWSTPNLYGLNLWGYQVNYTSPFGTPTTIITQTTTNDTEYTISGLTPNTEYSFRVSAVTPAGKNATGNIANAQTAPSFTIGELSANATNPLRLPIYFERDDINTTTTSVDVIYDDDFTLNCDIYQKFSQSTTSYNNINGTARNSNQETYTFYFINPENELITIDCYDTDTNATGTYQLIQSDFPLLDQFANFRNGTYGTSGQFGIFDLITLIVILFSMVGFNRVNPSVGAVFMTIIMGALAYFGIVQWYTAFAGFLALVVMAIFASTRKDD